MFLKKINFLKEEYLFPKFFLALIVVFLPFFILPFTQNPIEINKIYFFSFLTIISLFLYLFKISFAKEITIKENIIFFFVLLFILSSLLSSFLSTDQYLSFLGSFGLYNNGFFVLLFLILFSFLVFQVFDRPNILAGLFIFGTFISLLIFLLSGFLPVKIVQGFPSFFDFLKIRFFNPSSSFSQIFGLVLSVVAVFLIISFFNASKKRMVLISFLLALLFLTFFILNNKFVWLNISFSLIFFLLISLLSKAFKERINFFILPILLLFVSLFFLLFGSINQPAQFDSFFLGQRDSLQIAFSVLKTSLKNFFLGSGPGTFSYDYLKFKPDSLNQRILWSVNFDRAKNYFLNILTEQGILSFFFFLALVFSSFLSFWRNREKKEIFPYFFAYLSSIFALFFYPFSF
ncbi:MAG: hypothetical protein ACPLZH_00025, partial [Minisyncoccales bacterium]